MVVSWTRPTIAPSMPVVHDQLALGGLRLAKVLNKILGEMKN